MARRTIHVPDELDERVRDFGDLDDSYSKIVQDALREYLDGKDETPPEREEATT